ncbi:unnamed protein product [Closterium sp. Naga37s-1]|nr:unnamed protein product [Closterium sp. Naga37s-1]
MRYVHRVLSACDMCTTSLTSHLLFDLNYKAHHSLSVLPSFLLLFLPPHMPPSIALPFEPTSWLLRAKGVRTHDGYQLLEEGFVGLTSHPLVVVCPPSISPLPLLLQPSDVRTQGMYQMLDEGFVRGAHIPPVCFWSTHNTAISPPSISSHLAALCPSDMRTQGMYQMLGEGLHMRTQGMYQMLDEGFVGLMSSLCASDVRTQGMYQMLDEGFVGLIFSAFNRASSHAQAGQLQAVAFQSVSARDKEQREQRSRHTPARGQWAQLGTKREHSSHPSVSDLEPQELAVVLAAVDDDVPSSDFTAWEVPIRVVPSARAFPSLPRAHAVAPLAQLQRMLLMEEKEAYEKAVESMHTEATWRAQPVGADSPPCHLPGIPVMASRPPSPLPSRLPSLSLSTSPSLSYQTRRAQPIGADSPRCHLPGIPVMTSRPPSPLPSRLPSLSLSTSPSLCTRHCEPNPLELIHHHATYQAALCRLMETCLVPAIAALEDITRSNKAAKQQHCLSYQGLLDLPLGTRAHRQGGLQNGILAIPVIPGKQGRRWGRCKPHGVTPLHEATGQVRGALLCQQVWAQAQTEAWLQARPQA